MSEQMPEVDQESASKETLPSGEGLPAGMGYLLFVFGIGAGFLMAFFWSDFFGGSIFTVLSVLVVALLVLSGLVLLFFLFRRRILHYLFNVTQAQMASFAEPLGDVTRLALKKDADGATAAARRLVQLSLARYAWISTRRWIIASLTALIAAMAALGGTALLFRQNQLLEAQSLLLKGQNMRLSEQNRLISLDINLAEATRNAALVVEISNIAGELGKLAKIKAPRTSAKDSKVGDFVPLIADPMRDIAPGLVARIVSVSLATRPYKYLSRGADQRDQRERLNQALTMRPDLLKVLKIANNPSTKPARTDLIARAVSPERGQLMSVLLKSGIHKTEWLNFNGLDLSYAKVEIDLISFVSFFSARLAFADFSYVRIGRSDFGGATLDNARFQKSVIFDSSFASVDGNKVPEPYKRSPGISNSYVSGVDFSGSAIVRTRFDGAFATATRFDDAVLSDVSFRDTVLSAASFRNTVLIDVDFSDAQLHSVDLDGAIVFDKDFLGKLNKIAYPKTFAPKRYSIEPASQDAIKKHLAASVHISAEIDEKKIAGRPVFRIRRVGEFGK